MAVSITSHINISHKNELLHFKSTGVSSREFDMRVLFGIINSPLCENTRFTGADVARKHKM